jgi:hypothetical protein
MGDMEEEHRLQVSPEELKVIRETLLDRSLTMAQRYRSVFTLRNIGGDEAISILAECTLAAAHPPPSGGARHAHMCNEMTWPPSAVVCAGWGVEKHSATLRLCSSTRWPTASARCRT